MVYADDVNILGDSVYTVKENAEALVVPSKETGLEVNADKRVQTFGGTTLTNQNSIQEEIKKRLKSGNACYHSVLNLLSSSLLTKN